MKYFVVSDIHSHGQILKRDLAHSGFDKDDPNHALIVCGDIFDRGPDTMKTYRFLKSIPRERRILIRGNHEFLYKQLLAKERPDSYDISNGTVKTFCVIAKMPEKYISSKYWRFENEMGDQIDPINAENKAIEHWAKVKDKVAKSEVTEFMLDDSNWRYYFELKDYVFVHSFIPLKLHKRSSCSLEWQLIEAEYWSEYDPDWRSADPMRWEAATWYCPWQQFRRGAFKEDKKLVTGHRATEYYFYFMDNESGHEDCPIYDNHGLIGLDTCTVVNGRINVMTIEE